MMPDEYLIDIISKGGQGMQRSPRMPPFGGDLSENEINHVNFANLKLVVSPLFLYHLSLL
jgi:hypothetical protein